MRFSQVNTNTYEFVGGPLDDQVRACCPSCLNRGLRGLRVPEQQGGTFVVWHQYMVGTGGQRGKMVYQGIVEEDAP